MEVWGGVECTVNRVGNTFYDQLDLTGHSIAESDLELIAELGIHKIRYPALWERTAPNGLDKIDWNWLDYRLNRLRDLNIEPIVGLVHHGSGVLNTDLTQSSFVDGLANFADKVAKKFPWVSYYTVVNEPLTTARFSCLYSHWYPHLRCNKSFLKALVNQCEATVRAMDAIRQINPQAKLVQTEDIGKTFSTPEMQWQADWENLRRFWSLDYLMGTLHENKAFIDFSEQNSFSDFILTTHPISDIIIGINYYITSSRFLDHEVDRYPDWLKTDKSYIDTESIRVRTAGIPKFAEIMSDVWQRYKTPIALTEVHINSSPLNQVCWFSNAYNDAKICKANGMDIRGVTTWGMFGLHSWDKLVCSLDGCYEAGVFDVKKPFPHKTELFDYIQNVVKTGSSNVDSVGWWENNSRLIYGFSK